ncbi:MAG: restriction endonuclease subunit S [Thainema sp.]
MSDEPTKYSPLGILPHDWDVKPLKSLCTKIGSGATPRGGKDVYLDERVSHALIRSQHVFDHYFDETGLVYISEEHVQELRNVEVQSQDLLLNITGDGITFSRACMVPDRILPACVNQHVSIIRTDPNICLPGYLLGYLTLPGIKTYIESFNSGGSRRAITKGNIESFEIPLPPLNVQKEIAQTIQSLNSKIENLCRQNETLDAIAHSLFKHWFVDFEFPNADGKPYKSSGGEMEPSEIGEIPTGWHVGNLGDVVKVNAESISKGFTHKEIEYVDISSVGVGVLEGTTSYQLKKAPSRARRLVKHGDVIWSGVRPNRKSYLFISHPPDHLVVSTGFITLTPDLIPSSYLYSWVTTDSFVEYLTFNASGSAYPAVKAEHFEIAAILLPDKFTLSRFHVLVDPMREKIHQNSRQVQILTQTRDVLLPKLMSGKLRIKS